MTRDELIESLAQVAWEHDGVGGPWPDVGHNTRRDWLNSIEIAIQHLERMVPDVGHVLERATGR